MYGNSWSLGEPLSSTSSLALSVRFSSDVCTPVDLTIQSGEVGGFGARIASHFDNEAWAQYITGNVLLLVGPLFFAASIYMMLGRTIIMAGGEDISLIRPKWYTWIFVTADVTTLIIQGLGQ